MAHWFQIFLQRKYFVLNTHIFACITENVNDLKSIILGLLSAKKGLKITLKIMAWHRITHFASTPLGSVLLRRKETEQKLNPKTIFAATALVF